MYSPPGLHRPCHSLAEFISPVLLCPTLRFPLLQSPGVHAGALRFNPMLLPKLDRQERPRSRDRGNSCLSNSGPPSIRGSGSCLRLCRVVFACYTPTGGSRPTPLGTGEREDHRLDGQTKMTLWKFVTGRYQKYTSCHLWYPPN